MAGSVADGASVLPGPFFGVVSSAFSDHGSLPVGTAGHSSYADVAAFEANIHRSVPLGAPSMLSRLASPVSVSKPARVSLDPETVDLIISTAEEFSAQAAIFHFRGYWPSLPDLHAWISKQWEPLLDDNVHIFPVAKGFFVVKFDSIEDRRFFLCNKKISWDGRFPLLAKPWHSDFDPLSESFNKIHVWVRLPNLPLHLWQDSVLEAVGNALGDFRCVDIATTDIFHSTVARVLVEVDTSKGLPKMIRLDPPPGVLGLNFWTMRAFPSDVVHATLLDILQHAALLQRSQSGPLLGGRVPQRSTILFARLWQRLRLLRVKIKPWTQLFWNLLILAQAPLLALQLD